MHHLQGSVMQQAVAQQPWFMTTMGNPIVMGALGLIASKMMRNFTGRQRARLSGGSVHTFHADDHA